MNELPPLISSEPTAAPELSPALAPACALELEDMGLQHPEPPRLSEAELSDVVAMAWQDDTPFEAIALQFDLTEAEVIALMRAQLKNRSFRLWRIRVRARPAKHQARQLSAQRVQNQEASMAASEMALDDAVLEYFPLPPSALSRESLR